MGYYIHTVIVFVIGNTIRKAVVTVVIGDYWPHTSESNSAIVSIYMYILLWYVRLPNLNTKF